MKKKLVMKISLLSCLVLILFSIISCGVMAHTDNKILGENLIDLASTYAQALEVSDPETLVKTDKIAETRITVIDMTGKVVADSYGGENVMDNHLDRQEIKNAISGNNSKITRRMSVTANIELMYYAVEVKSGGQDYFLRVSRRTADITVYLATSVGIVAVTTIILTLIVYIFADRFARTSMMPLVELATNLKYVSEGKFSPIMPHKDSDEMNMLISKVNDIGELLADKLREINLEKDKLGYLLENMSQAVIALDSDDNVMFSNPRAAQLFGQSAMHGATMVAAIHERLIIEKYNEMKTSGLELFVWEKNGRFYRVSINKLQRSDNQLKSIILISDITKLRLAEMERKQFFANCSHELKTPLTAIKGYSELVAGRIATGDKAIECNMMIGGQAESLLSMINDMLILSRLDESIEVSEVCVVDIENEAKRLVIAYQPMIQEKQLNVSVIGCGKAYISKENASTILGNVLSNAIKYNVSGGSIDIKISEHNALTTLSVKDTGVGINKKNLPRVTERFYRADAARTDTTSSGLGLAIVKHLCMVSNSELKINSTIGKGTEVIIKFSTSEQ